MRVENYGQNKNIIFTASNIKRGSVARISKPIEEQLDSVVSLSKELLPKLMLATAETLEKYGIKETPINLQYGITFVTEKKNYIFSVCKDDSVRLRFQSRKTGDIEESIFIQDGQIAKTDTKNNVLPHRIDFFKYRENVRDKETLLKSGLDVIDYAILQIRKAIKTGDFKTNEPIIIYSHPDIIAPEIMRKELKGTFVATGSPGVQNKIINPTKRKKVNIISNGKLSETTAKISDEIISTFNEIHETLKKIKNSKTRNLIKNSYPTIQNGVAGSRILEFSVRHPYINSVSVNMLNDHYKKNLVIAFTEFAGSNKVIVITPENEVYKTIPMGILRDAVLRDGSPKLEFYTQEEIDKIDFDTPLRLVHDNLKKYKEFIDEKIEKLSGFKSYHSTAETGSVERFLPVIKNIYRNLKYFAQHISYYYADTNIRTKFKKVNGIEVVSYKEMPVKIYLNEVTPDRKSIFIKFGKTKDNNVTQIIVHKGEEIEKTYQILDDKLLKFKAAKLGMRPHYGRNIYYHTQNEIDNSGLEQILDIIEQRIKMVNKRLRDKNLD